MSLIFGFNQLKYLIFPPRYGTRVDYIFCGQEVMACWKAAKAWHSPKKINENHHPVFVVFNNQSCLEDPTSCIEYQEPEEQRGVGLNDAPPAPQQHRQEQQQQEPQEVQQQQEQRQEQQQQEPHQRQQPPKVPPVYFGDLPIQRCTLMTERKRIAIIEPTTRQEVFLDGPSADRKVPIPPKEKDEDREGKNELVKSSSGKKKKTPGQLRRAERRKEERNQKRLAAEEMRKAAIKAEWSIFL